MASQESDCHLRASATFACTNAPRVYMADTAAPHDQGLFNHWSLSMKSSAIVCAIAAASMGFSTLSLAKDDDRRGPGNAPPWVQQQGNGHGDKDRGGRNDQHGRNDDNRGGRGDGRGDDRHDGRPDGRGDDRHDPRYAQPRFDQRYERSNDRRDYYNARGPAFYRGGYIPREYRRHEYVVVNYRVHHLAPPPPRHEWVQVGADYVLIAIATGLIAHIVLSH